MSAETHDQICDTTSHLEHAIMFSLMKTNMVQNLLGQRGLIDHGNWLQAMTRIAVANPKMWSDNFLDNRNKILETADHFRESLIAYCGVVDRDCLLFEINILHNFAKDKQSPLIKPFVVSNATVNDTSINGFLAVLSLAIADNAWRIQHDPFQSLAPIAYPSFEDGLGPIAIDPENVRKLIAQNRSAIPQLVDDFLFQFNKTIELINAKQRDAIMQLVEEVSQYRSDLALVFEEPVLPHPPVIAPAGTQPVKTGAPIGIEPTTPSF